MALRRSGVRLPLSPPLQKCVSPNKIKGQTYFLFSRTDCRKIIKIQRHTTEAVLRKCLRIAYEKHCASVALSQGFGRHIARPDPSARPAAVCGAAGGCRPLRRLPRRRPHSCADTLAPVLALPCPFSFVSCGSVAVRPSSAFPRLVTQGARKSPSTPLDASGRLVARPRRLAASTGFCARPPRIFAARRRRKIAVPANSRRLKLIDARNRSAFASLHARKARRERRTGLLGLAYPLPVCGTMERRTPGG